MESFEKQGAYLEKPPVLFHASANRNISVFEPHNDSVRDPLEGPRIFATPDKAMASVFLVDSDDSWTRKGAFSGVPYIVINDRERFMTADKGGAIYSMDSNSFETNVEKGMGELEWTSTDAVTPTGKEEHESGLEAMLQNSVQVYFVDKKAFESIKKSSDHGLKVLQSSISENQHRGINVRILEG